LNYEHFPVAIDGLINFIESNSIYASEEEIDVTHSVYCNILHAEIGQFVKSLFENNFVDIYSILIKGEIWMKEIYF
jgi:hypothetical protein